MNTNTRLGIWMDHTSANIMEFTADPIATKALFKQLTHEDKEEALSKSEGLMHHKEQHSQKAYYKKLGDIIINYEEVLLFGPTDAKKELLNLLREDHRFDKVDIQLQNADKISEHQQHAFVREYFSKHWISVPHTKD